MQQSMRHLAASRRGDRASDLYPWAVPYVWDFRLSPHECGVALDYNAPLRPTLNYQFFSSELHDYPNQRLLGMIETGVIYIYSPVS